MRLVEPLLEEQVVQDEAEVGLAGAVVDQRHVGVILLEILQQRLDELEQVVDLLELAAAVLVHLAVAREDMQRLEQLDGLAGTDFVGAGRRCGGRLGRRGLLGHLGCLEPGEKR